MSQTKTKQSIAIVTLGMTLFFFQNCAEQELGAPNKVKNLGSESPLSGEEESGPVITAPMFASMSDASGISGVNRLVAGSPAGETLFNAGATVMICVEEPGLIDQEFKCFNDEGLRVVEKWVYLSDPLIDGSASGWIYNPEKKSWGKIYTPEETKAMGQKLFRHHFYDADRGNHSSVQFSII